MVNSEWKRRTLGCHLKKSERQKWSRRLQADDRGHEAGHATNYHTANSLFLNPSNNSIVNSLTHLTINYTHYSKGTDSLYFH